MGVTTFFINNWITFAPSRPPYRCKFGQPNLKRKVRTP